MQAVSRPVLMGSATVAGVAVALLFLTGGGSAARPRPEPEMPDTVQKPLVTLQAHEPSPIDDGGFERYRPLLKRNLFTPRLPHPPVAVSPSFNAFSTLIPVLPPVTAPVVQKPVAAPPAPPAAPPDPLKDWSYTGTVAIGSDVYAVLENKASKSGQYVKVGGTFEGATVDYIAQGEIAITLNGQARTLPKSSAFNATPLNGPPAPGAPPGAPGAQPGMPGQPPPGAAGPGMPGMPGGPNRPGGPPHPGGAVMMSPAPGGMSVGVRL